MNGPLRRLALQVTQTKVHRVHPMVRLPYAAAPDVLAEPPGETEPTPLAQAPTSDPDRDPVKPPAHHPDQRQAFPEVGSIEDPKSESTDSSTPAKPSAPVYMHADPAPAGITESNKNTAPGETVEPPAASATLPTPPVAANGPADETATPHVEANGATARPLEDVAPPQDRHNSLKQTSSQISNLPAPLIPARQASLQRGGQLTNPARPGPASNHSPAQSSVSQADRADEIHVHIGRIEVSAVQEPTAAAPLRKPKGRQPMSLDDYLAKRRQSK